MSERNAASQSVILPLSAEEAWTLHHALLDRLEYDSEAATAAFDGPATGPVRCAFETLDGGGRQFSDAELDAIQEVLATYHHSATWWEVERPRLERLLHVVSARLDPHQSPPSG